MCKRMNCITLANEILKRCNNDHNKAILICNSRYQKYMNVSVREGYESQLFRNIAEMYNSAKYIISRWGGN